MCHVVSSVLRNVSLLVPRVNSERCPWASTRPGLLAGSLAGRGATRMGIRESEDCPPSLLWGSRALGIITVNCINGAELDYPKIGR